MTSSGSSSETNAFAQTGGDPLAAWKSMAEKALSASLTAPQQARKNGASDPAHNAFDTEIGRFAKSLQRLHPAASESISATVSSPGSPPLSFDFTLRELAAAGTTAR